MRWTTLMMAAAMVFGAVATTTATTATAAVRVRAVPAGDQPPYPYADCLAAAKKNHETADHAKWHCDELVKKGWIKPPQTQTKAKAKPKPKPKAKTKK
ncbi:hypothetical protein [Streptomyces luteireticuli]|uniref:Uncharacterized protein n=1 Tax=Streptomyces luteireticuli TaxID=173858 RepID=A0ABP3IAT1_9ACTN